MTQAAPYIQHPDHPDLLSITMSLSRHAKNPRLRFSDRSVLYEIKTEAIRLLCQRGELLALETSPGAWEFGMAFIHAWPQYAYLIEEAERQQTAVTIRDLRQLQLGPRQLPFDPPATGHWNSLSTSQRRQLHPRGSWLVGFTRPGEAYPILHQPYLVITWLLPPPPSAPRQLRGTYGTPPTPQDPPTWNLHALLGALGIHQGRFPYRLREHTQHTRKASQHNPVLT